MSVNWKAQVGFLRNKSTYYKLILRPFGFFLSSILLFVINSAPSQAVSLIEGEGCSEVGKVEYTFQKKYYKCVAKGDPLHIWSGKSGSVWARVGVSVNSKPQFCNDFFSQTKYKGDWYTCEYRYRPSSKYWNTSRNYLMWNKTDRATWNWEVDEDGKVWCEMYTDDESCVLSKNVKWKLNTKVANFDEKIPQNKVKGPNPQEGKKPQQSTGGSKPPSGSSTNKNFECSALNIRNLKLSYDILSVNPPIPDYYMRIVNNSNCRISFEISGSAYCAGLNSTIGVWSSGQIGPKSALERFPSSLFSADNARARCNWMEFSGYYSLRVTSVSP